MANLWHSFSLEKTLLDLQSSELGLSTEEARRRLEQYGPNNLPSEKPRSMLRIFVSQFQSPLIYILLLASVIVYLLGEVMDSLIIMSVLLFNAVVGVVQEGKVQNTLLALKKYVRTNATVIRDGEELIIPDYEVVPGDILILQEGERIPADARVIVSQNLKLDESSFTGESEPVHKTEEAMTQENLPTSEQKNMVFMGTHIVSGNGQAAVVATGLSTVIGGIAKQISTIDTEVPLKANIRELSRVIIWIVSIINVILFTVGVLSGYSFKEMFVIVVSVSVAAIPEGLPIVITLVLATGVWRMSRQNALVKRLQAVEALGQAKVIAVDKTGTITKNELVVRKAWVNGRIFEVGGVGYEPKGEIKLDGAAIDAADYKELMFFGRLSGLCSAARLMYVEKKKSWRVSGDPTEAAMLVFSQKLGFHKDELLKESPLVSEIPFDYKLKYHATVNRVGNSNLLTVAGAPETILSLCVNIGGNEASRPISQEERAELEKIFSRISEDGFRILAVAVGEAPAPTLAAGVPTASVGNDLQPESVHSLSFVGFLAMQDTLRPEAALAVRQAEEAGIRVVMITGDHKITAEAIAKQAGIFHDGDIVLTGAEIDAMSDEELKEKLAKVAVFARVTPEHKKRIISIYKMRGEITAMTGDGVNDAPSLVAADLGVAMGGIGTEVAKEAADIVLLDDNFGSIVSAVEEGRNIYGTIKKVILFLLSTSLGEVLAIAVALFAGLPLPLLASQIIWLNFVTDGFLVVPLALDPKGKKLLSGAKKFNKYFMDSSMLVRSSIMTATMVAGTIALFCYYLGISPEKAGTVALTVLAAFQWFNAWNCRSEGKSVFQQSWLSNKFLLAATVTAVALQIVAIYVPIMQKLLHTVPLSWSDWQLILPVAASIVVAEEIRKFFYRRKNRANNAPKQSPEFDLYAKITP